MAIRNDAELAAAVEEAGALLQSIQDYVGRDFTRPAKVRFPRGYIRTAEEGRRRLAFLEDQRLRSNIAYTMQLADVQHWLMMRTDLSGMAKEMVIKLQIFLLGTIVESVTKVFLRGRCGGNFTRRAAYLHEQGIVSEALSQDIVWLWDMRNRMHLFQLEEIEWLANEYTVANHNKAVRTFRELITAINEN
jgi:hypothetical protein